MPRFGYSPPAPVGPILKMPLGGYPQRIDLFDDDGPPVGTLVWHSDGGGTLQIVAVAVAPAHQRRGHGSALLRECYRVAAATVRPTRAWASVRQRTQVTGRAFLTKHGYHQVATASNVAAGEEFLIYARAFD